MTVSTSRRADPVQGAANWEAPPAAQSFRVDSKAKHSRGMRTAMRIGWNLLPPLTFVAMVGLWWAAVEFFRIPAYLLPGPRRRFLAAGDRLRRCCGRHSKVTLTEILLGFGLTIVTAIPLGLLIALSPLAKQLVYPPIMLMQLVPKIAVAPLFLVWLGFGIESKVLLTVLMTFFPLLLASISGFQILDDRLLYLTKSMGATSWQTFRYLRFPAALAGHFLRHQDVGHDRGDGSDRRRVRRREQGPRLRAAARHEHDGHRARIRRARGADDRRHRDQLRRRILRMGDDAVAAGEEQLAGCSSSRDCRRAASNRLGSTDSNQQGGHMRQCVRQVACRRRIRGSTDARAGLAAAADTPVTFQLNWMAGGPNAGFAAAVAEGYYKDAGLDVTLVQGNGSGNTAQLVANGRAQLAYADAVAVSQLIAKGAPMKVVVDDLPVEPECGDGAQEERASSRSRTSRARRSACRPARRRRRCCRCCSSPTT